MQIYLTAAITLRRQDRTQALADPQAGGSEGRTMPHHCKAK